MQHLVDHNDLKFVLDRGHKPKGWVPGVIDRKTGKINPQVTKFWLGDNKYVSVFHVKPVYYETTFGTWRPLSEITSYHGNKRLALNSKWRAASLRYIDWLTKRQAVLGRELLLPTPFGDLHLQEIARPSVSLGLTTTTVYPDPSPETTTVDGYFYSPNISYSWATVIALSNVDGTGGAVSDTDTQLLPGGYRDFTGTNFWRYLERSMALFDTSAIGSDTIDSATLSLYGSTKADGAGNHNGVNVVSATPASNTGLVSDDFDQFGTTKFSTVIGYSSWSTTAYNDFTFNASGEAHINGSGVTKLGLKLEDDIDGTAPSPDSGTAEDSYARCHSADRTGTSEDPKLVVVHTAAASTFTPRVIFF